MSRIATDGPRPIDAAAAASMVGLCAIWAFGQIAIKLANEGISPLWQAGLRSGGAMVVMTAWMLARGIDLRPTPGTLGWMLLVGMTFTMEFVFLFSGLALTTAARGTVLLYTAPFFIAIGSHWLLRDRLTPVRMAGLVLAFVGVALALSDRGGGPGASGDWRGDLLCLAAGASWGLLTVIVKATPLRTERVERVLLGQLAVSAALLMAASTLIGEAGLFAPSARVWAGLAWQVVAVASFSYVGFFVMVQRHSPAQISSFTFLTPLFGVAFAMAILGEPLTPSLVGAAALIATGIWLVNRR